MKFLGVGCHVDVGDVVLCECCEDGECEVPAPLWMQKARQVKVRIPEYGCRSEDWKR